MGRYANPTTRFDFPDLSEDGDLIYVTIKNPKTVPLDQITPADAPVGPDGTPDEGAAKAATYDVIARLVTDWHVYDATLGEDDSPPLGLPATIDTVRTLPMEITTTIMKSIGDVLTSPQ
jgi:hypothetical protein